MEKHYFGKDLKVFFEYQLDSIPSSDSPSICVFSEKPTRDEAQACSGSFKVGSTISSWSDSKTRPSNKLIAITAIVDPAPDSDTIEDEYYLAINYTLKASGQPQTVIRPFIINRVTAQISAPNVNPIDIKRLLPALGKRLSDIKIDDFIDIAISLIKSDLLKRGYKWEQVTNQNDLNLAILYKSASLAEYSEFLEEGDQHYTRAKDYQSQYEAEINNLVIKVDTNQDGGADAETSKSVNILFNMK